MPAVHSRRIGAALWVAAVALLVPLAITLAELPQGGIGAWLRLGALLLVGGTLGVLLARQRAFERRVADQEQVESALRESEAKFSGILAIAADAIITVDHTQRIIHFNRGAEEIFGYTAADAIGRHLALLIPARYRAVHDRHMETFARSPGGARRMGERREIFGLRADGTEFPAEASISKLAAPDGIVFTVVLRDITERKRAEENERFMADASAALARSLDVDEAAQAVADLAVPRLGDVAFLDLLAAGDALRRIVGTRHRETLTPAVTDLARHTLTLDSPSPVIDVLRRRRAELVPAIDENWLEANEERAAIAAWRRLGATSMLIVPIVTSDEVLGALSLIAVDAARRFTDDDRGLATKFAAVAASTLQNARLYASARHANRARDEVLNVVSHDLRNPISAISMCARTLDENPPADDSKRHELLATIRESAAWTDRLIQDLVDVASIDQGRLSLQLQPSDPAQLVLQSRHMFEVEASQHGISLAQAVPTNLPLVMADSARIVQVLGNLLRNAIKFTPNGGYITVGAERRDSHVVFFVRDSGVGIATDKQARVFDRYWHSPEDARVRGTGLGLSIAKGIVEAHAGEIWLESVHDEADGNGRRPGGRDGSTQAGSGATGRGTTFYFSVPVASAGGT